MDLGLVLSTLRSKLKTPTQEEVRMKETYGFPKRETL